MLLRPLRFAPIICLALTIPSAADQQERDRAHIPDQYKWKLQDLYPSDEAWNAAKEKATAEIPSIRPFKGTLGTSASHLADALDLTARLNKDVFRLYSYASLNSDQDTRVPKYRGMVQEMVQVASQLGAETAFMEPEILKIDQAVIDRFVSSEPRLKIYQFYLQDIQRRRPHTGSDAEEPCSPRPRSSETRRPRSLEFSRTRTFRTRPSRSATASR
jgi:oligoendopeptidase F